MLHSNEPLRATQVPQYTSYEVINETTEECNEKRLFIINTIKDFLEINFSDAHVLAVLYRQYSYFVERGTNRVRPNTVANYIKKEHQNILF